MGYRIDDDIVAFDAVDQLIGKAREGETTGAARNARAGVGELQQLDGNAIVIFQIIGGGVWRTKRVEFQRVVEFSTRASARNIISMLWQYVRAPLQRLLRS